MHQQPGDISKGAKIAMMEGRDPRRKLSKSFKKDVLARERTVLRERTRSDVKTALEDVSESED
jgi:hypothetical protein